MSIIECQDCVYQWDCEKNNLCCCSDGKTFDEIEEEGE